MRVADEMDRIRAAFHQPLDCDPPPVAVVGAHPCGIVERGAPKGDGIALRGAFAEIVPCGLVGRRADHDDAIGLPPRDVMAEQFLGFGLERDERFVAALRRRRAGAAQHRIVKRIDRGSALPRPADHDDRDRPGFATPQTGRAGSDVVAELLCRLLHPAAGRFGNGFGPRKRPADGRLANPCTLGNIDRGHAPRRTVQTVRHPTSHGSFAVPPNPKFTGLRVVQFSPHLHRGTGTA